MDILTCILNWSYFPSQWPFLSSMNGGSSFCLKLTLNGYSNLYLRLILLSFSCPFLSSVNGGSSFYLKLSLNRNSNLYLRLILLSSYLHSIMNGVSSFYLKIILMGESNFNLKLTLLYSPFTFLHSCQVWMEDLASILKPS